MGQIDRSFELDQSTAFMLVTRVCVVACAAEIQQLQASAGSRFPGDLQLVPAAPDQPLDREIIGEADILVLEVAVENPASMQRVAQVREERPDLPLIVALKDPSFDSVRALLRLGVGDVVQLPFVVEKLVDQIVELAASSSRIDHLLAPRAPLVPVVRSTGGSGATTLILHLASALAERLNSPLPACAIDLDIQSGNIGGLVKANSKLNVMELIGAQGRLDAELMRSMAIDAGYGFEVIAAPNEIMPLELVDTNCVLKLINIARRNYGAVLVDLPADWTNWALSVLLEATDIVIVMDLSISGLRQAKRKIDLFASVGIPAERLRIVVNRFERRLFPSITMNQVKETLGHEIFATLSSERGMLQKAQDEGVLVSDLNPKNPYARDIAAMAERLSANWDC